MSYELSFRGPAQGAVKNVAQREERALRKQELHFVGSEELTQPGKCTDSLCRGHGRALFLPSPLGNPLTVSHLRSCAEVSYAIFCASSGNLASIFEPERLGPIFSRHYAVSFKPSLQYRIFAIYFQPGFCAWIGSDLF